MVGIKETKELLDFVIALGNATSISLEDGKFFWSEFTNYIGALIKLPVAIQDIEQVPVEMKDLDDAEAKELLQYAKDKLDIPEEELEVAIEEHLALGLEIYKLLMKYYV